MPDPCPSPFVLWAQTKDQISLKVDLKDTINPLINIESNKVTFSGVGKGARGLQIYRFELKLYEIINPEGSSYDVLPSQILFKLEKAEKGYWPRLIQALQKPAWLKIDFDKWVSDDGITELNETVPDILEQYPEIFKNLQKEEKGYITESFKKVYLILYNLFQFCGFLYIFVVLSLRYAEDPIKSVNEAYLNVGTAMKLCTLFQWLEVGHPLFGYTKSAVLPAFVQVGGRNIILFAMIDSEERMQTKPVVFYLFIVWTFIELIRYPYYIAQLSKVNIGFLTWLRYTIWIPLYPLGFLCEGVIVLRNIPYFEETSRFSIDLPNKWNFVFHMPSIMRFYLLFFLLPVSYVMMRHMYKERVRKLASKGWKNKLH